MEPTALGESHYPVGWPGAHLGPICTSITSYVTDDLREVLGVLHDEHMAEHFEVGKVGCQRLDLMGTCQRR